MEYADPEVQLVLRKSSNWEHLTHEETILLLTAHRIGWLERFILEQGGDEK